jgi:hypothetical protein
MRKLNFSSFAALVRYAIRNRIVEGSMISRTAGDCWGGALGAVQGFDVNGPGFSYTRSAPSQDASESAIPVIVNWLKD